jgi:hypothetical protein
MSNVRQVNVVWVERVVVRENGVCTDKPHQLNPETGTHAVCAGISDDAKYDAGFEAGFYCGQQLPADVIARTQSPMEIPSLPILDVNDGEQLDEDGGLF